MLTLIQFTIRLLINILYPRIMRTTFASKILRKTGCIPTYFDFKIFMIPYFIKKVLPNILHLLQDTTLNKGRSIPIIVNTAGLVHNKMDALTLSPEVLPKCP